MNKEDQEKLDAHLKIVGPAAAKAGADMSTKFRMKPGDRARVTGNTPEFGRYEHNYAIGQIVTVVQWIPFNSGKLPQFTNGKKGRKMINNVLDLPQFEVI